MNTSFLNLLMLWFLFLFFKQKFQICIDIFYLYLSSKFYFWFGIHNFWFFAIFYIDLISSFFRIVFICSLLFESLRVSISSISQKFNWFVFDSSSQSIIWGEFMMMFWFSFIINFSLTFIQSILRFVHQNWFYLF